MQVVPRFRYALLSCLVAVLFALGCSEDTPQSANDGGGETSADTEGTVPDDGGDVQPPRDTEPETGPEAGPDAAGDADTDVEDTGPSRSVYRLIVMGDTGEGNDGQERVAKGAQKRCDERGGCHGFLMLGDNIYDDGPESATDDEFDSKVDKPYRRLKYGAPPPDGQPDERRRMPIYVSLGNHDLGGAGLESSLIQYYLDYADRNSWFYYPAEYWEKRLGFVHLVSIHTNPMAYEGTETDPQGQLVDRVVQNTSARWTVVFGHHEYRSNGQHGNAGSYEGIPGDLTVLGGEYREWINEHVCDDVDFLFTAHDHNRQWIERSPELTEDGEADSDMCNTHLAVSGAGAKTRDMEDRGNDLAFGEPTRGFMLAEFRRDRVRVEYCDENGTPEWSKTITK